MAYTTIHPINTNRLHNQPNHLDPKRSRTKRIVWFSLAGFVAIFAIGHYKTSKTQSAYPAISSGIVGYCLDDYKDSPTILNKVILWKCNNSAAQDWTSSSAVLTHADRCLTAEGNRKTSGTPIVADNCSGGPGQVWLQSGNELFNPNSQLCLAAPHIKQQLTLARCDSTTNNQHWSIRAAKTSQPSSVCQGSARQLIGCFAEQEWSKWQAHPDQHTALLNIYTDNTPYEAWCADFVSYIYKEAGHPFTEAYNGWDENNANNIQNYGFTMHTVGSGYVPQTGDIAYFDYNGGHVEIVVSGSQTPTFIYGNSATVDPITGNGQMKANTITSDGPEGRLLYYLSPEFSNS